MNINYTNNINFRAKYKDYTPNIKKLQSRDKYIYKDEQASLAEIDLYDKRDMKALKDLTEDWDKAIFAENIYLDAKRASEDLDSADKRFFIITEQKDYLDYKKILAICEIKEYNDKEIYLDYIQTNPESVYNPYSKYKKIGTALLTCLKHYYDKINLFSLPSHSVLSFYKRNKFNSINNEFKYNLSWERTNENK